MVEVGGGGSLELPAQPHIFTLKEWRKGERREREREKGKKRKKRKNQKESQ